MMEESEFWELIDATRQESEGDPEEHAELLVERLFELDPDSVVDFARHFESRYNRTYQWDLRAAAHVLLGAVDDDGFDFFRCWLIGQGREVFEHVVHEPDRFPELVPDFDEERDGDAEELGYAADEAYEQLTGGPLPDLSLPAPAQLEGTPLDVEDAAALAERLPKTWSRFGAARPGSGPHDSMT